MKLTITSITLIVASVSAVFLVTACDSSRRENGFTGTDADKAAEARLGQVGAMPHLAFYDEGFYPAPAEDDADATP